MHILVTNDDGPPSAKAAPFLLPFIQHLENAGHVVSVIIPDVQRSWIGKAHLVGKEITTTPYWPPSTTPAEHTHSAEPNDSIEGSHPWILVDSTPATCIQIGLSHFFQDRGPIDLVISGPNFGRNTAVVFALSSGTLGAALESTVCGLRSIALSFAFFDRHYPPDLIEECCRHAVKVCEWLAREASWGESRLYSVNVPLKEGVSGRKVVWTRMWKNTWKKGACFQEVEESGEEDKQGSASNGGEVNGEKGGTSGARKFKWAPRFTDVFNSVSHAGPGVDGWTITQGETSVTALHANFEHADDVEVAGEIDLASHAPRQVANM